MTFVWLSNQLLDGRYLNDGVGRLFFGGGRFKGIPLIDILGGESSIKNKFFLLYIIALNKHKNLAKRRGKGYISFFSFPMAGISIIF